MKMKQLIVMFMLSTLLLALTLNNKSGQKNTSKSKGQQRQKQKAKSKSKSKHRNTDRHRNRYNKSDKILKKYKFSEDADGAAAPADGAGDAKPADGAGDAKPADAKPADAGAGDAKPAETGNKGADAMGKMGFFLTKEQKAMLEQKEKLDKSKDMKDMLRQFKTLAEPSKIFTEGPLDIDKPQLVLTNSDSIPDDYDKMESTKECEYKEGYLAYINDIKMPNLILKGGKKLKYPVMTGIAVLGVLNKDSLSLFDKEHVNSLLRTYDIKHLQPYVDPTNFGDLQCFQLISNVNFNEVILTKSPESTFIEPSKVMATLCCSTREKVGDWKNAIERFSNCKAQVAEDKTEAVENTFSTIQHRAKILRERIKQDEKVNQEYSKTNNAQELLMVQKYVENMKKAVADEVNKQNQDKRELTVKLENDIKKSVSTTMQEECLEKALQIQQDEESRAVENMIQSESETREEEELKKQQEDLIKQLKEKGKNIALQEETLDESIKRMTKQMQYNMVQSVEEFQRTLSPDMCNFNKADFPKGVVSKEDRMNYVCTQLIDPQAVDIETINDCMVPDYFCDVCCNYNIGPADEVGREKCAQECKANYMDKDSNRFELIYVLEVNPSRLKNFLVAQSEGNTLKSAITFLQLADPSYKSKWQSNTDKEKKNLQRVFGLSDSQLIEVINKKGW